VIAADVTGDGNVDLLATSEADDAVAVLVAAPTGIFSDATWSQTSGGMPFAT